MLTVGDEVAVRRADPDVVFVVVHVLGGPDRPGEPADLVGEPVGLDVDVAYRTALSRAHSACHLVALALNEAIDHLWRKGGVRRDSLGSGDFDAVAIVESRITENGSIDRYRLGSAVRRAGLDRSGLVEQLDQVLAAVNARCAEWLATDAAVWVDAEGPGLSDRRHWRCDLPKGSVTLPCGGTHVSQLTMISSTEVTAETSPDHKELTVVTRIPG